MAIQPVEYTADTSGYYMTNTGTWSTESGTKYYHIFPLEIGKVYKIILPTSNPLTRWRNSLADSNIIGSANLTWVGGTDSPASGSTIYFIATQPYLISYGGITGGIVNLDIDIIAGVSDLTGTKWQFNETLTSHMTQDSYHVYGRIYNDFHEIILESPATFAIRGQFIPDGGYSVLILTNGVAWAYPAFRINSYGEFRNWSYRETSQSPYSYTPAPILEISGGDPGHLRNPILIYWLETNAKQILPGYSITYHANGGTPIPTDLTEQTALPSPLPTVAKDGFAFNGWYTDSTFTTPAVAGAEISADTDLYAKFTALPSNITLDLSTLDLPEGSHSIQMKLSDDGVTKRDSELSNAVTYTVSAWEYPVQDGDTLTITQANAITQSGDTLVME